MKHEFEKEGDMMEQMIEAAGLQCASSRQDAMRDVAFDVKNSDVPTFLRNMDSFDARRRASRVIIGVCAEHGVRMAKRGHSTMCLTLRGKIVFSMMGALLCLCMIGLLMPQVARAAPDPSAVYSYTVLPGVTLWSYASAITPDGGDVRDSSEDLISLYSLDGVALQAGQLLKGPIV